jgi:hypothetical protein
MKITKAIIRVWITTTSVVGFLGAWGLLSHAPKPAPAINQPNVTISASMDNFQLPELPQSNGNFQSLQPQQSPSFSTAQMFPQLRTRGS